MICDHNTIKKTSTESQFTLVYCGSEVLFAKYTSESTESRHTTETFETIQELIDRGLDLGLSCSVDFQIKALEHGAFFPPEIMTALLGVVWDLGKTISDRMNALGYEKPVENLLKILREGL